MTDRAAAEPAAGEAKRRVVILGAGPAGLAAAAGLSATEDLRKRYEVHVYQAGDRPGGKCKTSRPQSRWARIEQNGSHYIFGCYHNAFALLTEAYRTLGARPVNGVNDDFGSFETEFVPRPFLAAKQRIAGAPKALNWFISFPATLSEPGRGSKWPRPFDYLASLSYFLLLGILALVTSNGEANPCSNELAVMRVLQLFPFDPRPWPRRARAIAGALAAVVNGPLAALGRGLAALVGALWRSLLPASTQRAASRWVHDAAIRGVARARDYFRSPNGFFEWIAWIYSGDVEVHKRRGRLFTDLVFTLMLGVLRERLWAPGMLERLDAYDLRDWLSHHGLLDETRTDCPLLQVWYDAVAAYEDGDERRPRISAAPSLYAMFRAIATYKGALAFQMRNEVGDAFVAPVFQMLRDRGVQFHFLSRIREVVPGEDADGNPIVDHIVVEDQRPLARCFDPLGTIEGGGDRLLWLDALQADNGEPLDSFWAPHSGSTWTLQTRTHDPDRGFDDVIFALPVGMVPIVCPRLVAADAAWGEMVAKVKTTETQSLRLWFLRALPELGWPGPPPILSAFDWPFSTWENNESDCLLAPFRLPSGEAVKTIATVFGPLDVPPRPGERLEDQAYVLRRAAFARRAANRFITQQVAGLWDLGPGEGAEPNWDVLAAPEGYVGRNRFRWQSVSANAGPIESYTQALPRSLRARLRADESGFGNLFLAGDWTRNGVEVGCLEGAVISGLEAARAICGSPESIPGARDLDFGLFNPN